MEKQHTPTTNVSLEEIIEHTDSFINTDKENVDEINSVNESIPIIEDQKTTKKPFKQGTPLVLKVEEFIKANYEIRLDIIKNNIEVKRLGYDEEFRVDDKFEANLVLDLMRNGFKGVSQIVKALLGSDFVECYHPIKTYFENLEKWDSIDRITQMAECLIAFDTSDRINFNLQFKKQILRCIATVFVPGYFNKQCFVLVGNTQNQGKSTFIRSLLPNELKSYLTDMIIETKDKDAHIALGTYFFINMDELANLNKDETNSLKSTLSRDYIKVRRPYAKTDSEIARLANFWGSTNDLQFLSDLTGNVRWICFRIQSINFDYSKIDINQFWAQAYHLFSNKFTYNLTREEVLHNEKQNAAFMLSNPEVDAIRKHLYPAKKNEQSADKGISHFATTTELMKLINEKGYSFKNSKRFGQALQACEFENTSERLKAKDYPVYGYWYFECEDEIDRSEDTVF